MMDLRCNRWSADVSSVKMLLLICCLVCTLRFSDCLRPNSEIRDWRTKKYMQEVLENGHVAERRLIGPGSHPPRCMYKCGSCSPCRPVHVAVPPGSHVIMEYYPIAWRCKCGNQLYMP